jgi:hypothetical protein
MIHGYHEQVRQKEMHIMHGVHHPSYNEKIAGCNFVALLTYSGFEHA